MKCIPCRKCIKSAREYDPYTRTIHLECVEHHDWCQYAAKKCAPLPEWEKVSRRDRLAAVAGKEEGMNEVQEE
jgi:hypothetical protein